MLRVRCPRLADRVAAAPAERAAKYSRTAKSSSCNAVSSYPASIAVGETSGSSLSHLVLFLYTDALPSAWTAVGADADQVISEALSLMITARDLCPLGSYFLSSSSSSLSSSSGSSAVDTSSMRRLQALCEAFVASCVSVPNLPSVLARALNAHLDYIQQVCYQMLAKEKPTASIAFNVQLLGALSSHPQASAVAVAAVTSGLYQPSYPTVPLVLPASPHRISSSFLFLLPPPSFPLLRTPKSVQNRSPDSS